VLDFGISKVGGISSSGLTQTGDIVGTSQYLSPEQAAGLRHVTEASDQYSLGVVIYECVTRQTPQRGEPIYSLLRNVTDGRHTPPRELRADLPPALEALIERDYAVVRSQQPEAFIRQRDSVLQAHSRLRRGLSDLIQKKRKTGELAEENAQVLEIALDRLRRCQRPSQTSVSSSE